VWFVFFHELPDGFVGFLFADAVGDVGVLGFLGVLYCKLGEFVSSEIVCKLDWGRKGDELEARSR
jgi:hypothetical protein